MDENNEMTVLENTTPEFETSMEAATDEGPSVAVVGLVGAAIGATALFVGQKIVKGIGGLIQKNKEKKAQETVQAETEKSEETTEKK